MSFLPESAKKHWSRTLVLLFGPRSKKELSYWTYRQLHERVYVLRTLKPKQQAVGSV